MSQTEIFEMLAKAKEPLTCKEIAKELGISPGKVSQQVCKLKRYYQNIEKDVVYLPGNTGQLYKYVTYKMIEG